MKSLLPGEMDIVITVVQSSDLRSEPQGRLPLPAGARGGRPGIRASRFPGSRGTGDTPCGPVSLQAAACLPQPHIDGVEQRAGSPEADFTSIHFC